MSKSAQYTQRDEADPIPSDVSPTAAARGDAERGYSDGEDGIASPASDLKHGELEKRSSSAEREAKGRHGKGLTEGDAGESLAVRLWKRLTNLDRYGRDTFQQDGACYA
jgi:hypothetical protein